MVLSLKNSTLGGVHGVPGHLLVTLVPWPHPFSGSLKPIENLFFELFAAYDSFQELLGALGIDSSC